MSGLQTSRFISRVCKFLLLHFLRQKNELAPEVMKKNIEFKEPSCGLRPQGNYFARGNVKSTHYSIQSIRYLAPKI